MTRHTCIFIALLLLGLAAAALSPPMPQDPAFHAFADQRSFFGVPNFYDVVSNIPFVVVGVMGLVLLAGGTPPGGLPPLLLHYRIYFVGVLLTGLGSMYYHLNPDNTSLVWDRMPMTIAFMAFFSALMGESMSLRLGRALLWPLLLVGILSVVYWHWTEQLGRGDLRPYVLVQFLPILLTPYILLFLPSPFAQKRPLWLVAGCYVAAKLLEVSDHFWFNLSGEISGHTLKHLVAAGACYWMYYALRHRRLRLT